MKIVSFCLAMMLSLAGFSQTQAEIDKRMKEAQEVLDKLTPEQKKMMEQMGINPDPMKGLPSTNTPQAKQAMSDHNNYIPKKDDAGIAAANKTVLTNSNTASFISSTHSFVSGKLKPEAKALGEKAFKELVAQKSSAITFGNNAIGLWMAGQPELALYLMGKACLTDPLNTDNLGNYASMLSMSGAPQLAVPILNKLNSQFPKNSTILNNLGQAWFGLGDLAKAKKYLDTVMAKYPYHPHANMTAAAIEESNGNTAAAAEFVKRSIRHAYTNEKHNKLRKLGVKLDGSDIHRHAFKKDSDPMGLHNFKHPPIPKSSDELAEYAGQWKQFKDELLAAVSDLAQQRAPVSQAKAQEAVDFSNNYLNNGTAGVSNTREPPMASLGNFMLQAMQKDGGSAFRMKSSYNALKAYETEMKKLKAEYDAEVKKIDAKDQQFSADLKRAGGDEKEGFCSERKQLLSKYLLLMGTRYEELYNTYLKELSISMNEEVYWKQFAQAPDKFQTSVMSARSQWLSALMPKMPIDLSDPQPFNGYKCNVPKQEKWGGKLGDFDVINCQLRSKMNLIVLQMENNCNTMTTKLNAKIFEASMTQDMNKAGFLESFQSGSVKMIADVEAPFTSFGPFEVGPSVEQFIEVEFTREGIQDFTYGGEVGVFGNAVEGKISLISGKVTVESSKILWIDVKN